VPRPLFGGFIADTQGRHTSPQRYLNRHKRPPVGVSNRNSPRSSAIFMGLTGVLILGMRVSLSMWGYFPAKPKRYPQRYAPMGVCRVGRRRTVPDGLHRQKPINKGSNEHHRTASVRSWRKRVGVEPTKSRLATLSGFEGQPPHRESFPSIIMIAQNCNSVTSRSQDRTARAWRGRCGGSRRGGSSCRCGRRIRG
jgi:hypothetical protein